MGYRKTTVEIDVEELQKAQESLQTHGIKETVNAALREVNRRSALREAAAYVLSGSMHVPDEEAWAGRRETRSYLPQFVTELLPDEIEEAEHERATTRGMNLEPGQKPDRSN